MVQVRDHARVQALPHGEGAVVDLDASMADCNASFTKLFTSLGVPAAGGEEALAPCVSLGCLQIGAGKTSTHATSSMAWSKKFGALTGFSAEVRERLRVELPASPWFKEHVQPLRARMGYPDLSTKKVRRRKREEPRALKREPWRERHTVTPRVDAFGSVDVSDQVRSP